MPYLPRRTHLVPRQGACSRAVSVPQGSYRLEGGTEGGNFFVTFLTLRRRHHPDLAAPDQVAGHVENTRSPSGKDSRFSGGYGADGRDPVAPLGST